MTVKVPISDLRSNLKQYLSQVLAGGIIALTKHGKVVAYLQPASVVDGQQLDDYESRLASYRDGGIIFHDDIVDQPLQAYDYIDTDLYSGTSIAAEPKLDEDAGH